MENIIIVYCNYLLVSVPLKCKKDLKLPKNDMRYRRAIKAIRKHDIKKAVITINKDTGKMYRDPNIDLGVRRIARRTIKLKDNFLYVRDIEVIKELGKPTKEALK